MKINSAIQAEHSNKYHGRHSRHRVAATLNEISLTRLATPSCRDTGTRYQRGYSRHRVAATQNKISPLLGSRGRDATIGEFFGGIFEDFFGKEGREFGGVGNFY